jgi:hypothetical protein
MVERDTNRSLDLRYPAPTTFASPETDHDRHIPVFE